MHDVNVVYWNAIIKGYVIHDIHGNIMNNGEASPNLSNSLCFEQVILGEIHPNFISYYTYYGGKITYHLNLWVEKWNILWVPSLPSLYHNNFMVCNDCKVRTKWVS